MMIKANISPEAERRGAYFKQALM